MFAVLVYSVVKHSAVAPRCVRAVGWRGRRLYGWDNIEQCTHICAQMQTVKPSVLAQSCVQPLSAPLRVRLQPCLHCNVGHLIRRRDFSIVHPFVRGALLNAVEVSSVSVTQHTANHPKYRTLPLSDQCRSRFFAFGLSGSLLIAILERDKRFYLLLKHHYGPHWNVIKASTLCDQLIYCICPFSYRQTASGSVCCGSHMHRLLRFWLLLGGGLTVQAATR